MIFVDENVDEDGNAHEIYNGYINDNENLTRTMEIIGGYSVD